MQPIDRLPEAGSAFNALRQFARRKRNVERCELCSLELLSFHPHLLELKDRRLVCSCDACALLFTGQANSRYKRVPRRVRILQSFELTESDWESLLIPINMAFFFTSSVDGSVHALYPSPAGATESLLTLESWAEIVEKNPVVAGMESDVEALLVNRGAASRGHGEAEYFLLPIDECYKLVGLIRRHWRGFSGGQEVWQEIAGFFSNLREHATRVVREQHA